MNLRCGRKFWNQKSISSRKISFLTTHHHIKSSVATLLDEVSVVVNQSHQRVYFTNCKSEIFRIRIHHVHVIISGIDNSVDCDSQIITIFWKTYGCTTEKCIGRIEGTGSSKQAIWFRWGPLWLWCSRIEMLPHHNKHNLNKRGNAPPPTVRESRLLPVPHSRLPVAFATSSTL